jgi:hypothetical protein
MRTLKIVALGTLLAVAAGTLFQPARAQTANPDDIKALATEIQTLQDQQKTITDNQAKIDAKLADVVENIRVARLYGARVR